MRGDDLTRALRARRRRRSGSQSNFRVGEPHAAGVSLFLPPPPPPPSPLPPVLFCRSTPPVKMNSSDEEKQLQLITNLKEQGRRARGRQVRAARPMGGAAPGRWVEARGSGAVGGAAAWAPAERRYPCGSIPRAPRASESPGPRVARGGGECRRARQCGKGCCPPVALAGDPDPGCWGKGTRIRLHGPTCHAGLARGAGYLGRGWCGQLSWPCSLAWPHPCPLALGGLQLALQPSQLFSLGGSSSSFFTQLGFSGHDNV